MFVMRTSLPEYGNKFYNNGNNGGYSWCIDGYPTCEGRNVLANCVGYACGRFNEIIGTMKYPEFCCNAENFIEVAKRLGLEVKQIPSVGAIMVWQKGSLSSGDGAGHVAIVERIDSNNQVYTSESGYGGSAFWNSIRTNDNGNWGQNSNYSFRGFIINPSIVTIKYQAHIQNIGWEEWKQDGETAGTEGQSLRLEAIRIDAPFEIEASAHLEGIGWVDYGKITKDSIIGTVGESRRLECLKLKGNFEYQVHIQNSGWSTWTQADGIATLGSVGESLRIEAIRMRGL